MFLFISENILYLISGMGLIQGLFLASLIYFHPKSDRTVNRFLALYVLCLSVILCLPFVLRVFTWRNSFFIEPFPILLGPSIYLYIKSFREDISLKKAFPHMIFFFLFFFISYGYYNYLASHYNSPEEVAADMGKNPVSMIFAIVKISWYVFYYFLSRKAIRQYDQSFHQFFSSTGRIDRRWARWLNNGTIVFVGITFVVNILMFIFPTQFSLLLLINVAIITPYLYLVAYKGITQSTPWRQMGFKQEEIKAEMKQELRMEMKKKGDIPSEQKVKINDDRIITMTHQILSAMEQEKLYRESELTLQDLADKLHVPTHQVSQAINEGLKKNFYEVINGYRVEEAKKLLTDPRNKNYTILSVAFEAGFNSKKTFNTVFKKFTGLSPLEFKKNNNGIR